MPRGKYVRTKKNHNFIDRTGETKTMNNGLKATITEYQSANNMTIQFENGAVTRHKAYNEFQRGRIKCPMLYEPIDDYIKCTNPNTGLVFLIDKDDLNKIQERYWSNNGSHVCSGHNSLLIHRFIMNCPKGMVVDHINCNPLDNRKSNLRICTITENNRNTKIMRNNKSGYKGVSWDKYMKKWVAFIRINNKSKSLGYFNTPELAHAAYCAAAKEHFGEFARFA